MMMSNPRAVHGRVRHGGRPNKGTNRKAAPVRMTNQMTVMHKGRGKKRSSKRR